MSEVVGFDGGADAAAEERNEKGFGVVLLGVEVPAAPGEFFTDENATHHVKA